MAGHGPSELWRNVQGYFITRRTAHPTKTNTLTISLFFLRKTTRTATLDKTEKDLLGPLLVRVFDRTITISLSAPRFADWRIIFYHITSLIFIYRIGELAQMVERPLCMREVSGSIPGFSNWCPHTFIYSLEKACLVKYWQSISFVNFNIWLFQLSLATV